MFHFRLALLLGYANPDDMLDEMPASIFDEWVAYSREEPLDVPWVRTASLQALIANIHRDPKKGQQYNLDDFLPREKRLADKVRKILGKHKVK